MQHTTRGHRQHTVVVRRTIEAENRWFPHDHHDNNHRSNPSTALKSRHRECYKKTLQWCHNGRDGVSNHQPHDCLLNRLLWRRSKKTSKLRVTGLCEGNSPVTGEFPAQRTSNVENVSIQWCHHVWVFKSRPRLCVRPWHEFCRHCTGRRPSTISKHIEDHKVVYDFLYSFTGYCWFCVTNVTLDQTTSLKLAGEMLRNLAALRLLNCNLSSKLYDID